VDIDFQQGIPALLTPSGYSCEGRAKGSMPKVSWQRTSSSPKEKIQHRAKSWCLPSPASWPVLLYSFVFTKALFSIPQLTSFHFSSSLFCYVGSTGSRFHQSTG
jgi:hypothetical protein